MKKAAVFLSLLLCACAPAALVTPQAGGSYSAEAEAETRAESIRATLDAAQKTCQPRRPSVIEQKTEYRGTVSEQVNQNMRNVASIAAAYGAAIPTPATAEDYRTTLVFFCE